MPPHVSVGWLSDHVSKLRRSCSSTPRSEMGHLREDHVSGARLPLSIIMERRPGPLLAGNGDAAPVDVRSLSCCAVRTVERHPFGISGRGSSLTASSLNCQSVPQAGVSSPVPTQRATAQRGECPYRRSTHHRPQRQRVAQNSLCSAAWLRFHRSP